MPSMKYVFPGMQPKYRFPSDVFATPIKRRTVKKVTKRIRPLVVGPVRIEPTPRRELPALPEHSLAEAALLGRLSAVRSPLDAAPPANLSSEGQRAWLVARLRRLASAFGHSRPSLLYFAGYGNKAARRGASS